MTTIDELIEKAEMWQEDKYDFVGVPSELQFKEAQLAPRHISGGDWSYPLEDQALGHIASKLDVPINYLRKCPTTLIDTNLNYWLHIQEDMKRRNRPLLVRTHDDAIRAFADYQAYTVVDNLPVLKAIKELMPPGVKLVRPILDRDGLVLRLMVREGDGGGNYGWGALVKNGEILNRSLGVMPFIQQHSCTNSTVWQEGAWTQRHAWRNEAGIVADLKESIGTALRVSAEMVEMAVEAEREKIPEIADVIKSIVKAHKFNEAQESLIFVGTENKRTRMGVVSGLTFMAQSVEDPDTQIEIESLAGRILAGKQSLFGMAAAAYQVDI